MDLEEWEFLPDDGFLDFHEDGDGGGKKKISRDPKGVFNMNYFICPSPNSQKPLGNSRVSNQLVPVPIQLDLAPDHEVVVVKEVTKEVPIKISIAPSVIKAPNFGASEADQDPVSQVFFKKMKENEFVDMKMDSPKSGNRGIMPQIDAGTFQFEDKSEAYKGETIENKNSSSPKMKIEKDKSNLDSDIKEKEVTWEDKTGGLNMWRWGLTGIGGLCSIGVAAATICILIFGTHQRSKHHQHNPKLRFQIITDDKRIKQVVHHATKLNEAISAVRGVPLTRAQITYGGYYDGL